MAHSRSASLATADSEFRDIIAWYEDKLASTEPPAALRWQPVRIGPTWQWRDGWVLPEFTLGWRVLAWCGVWLRDKHGQSWQFTAEQARFVLWYFAIDPESGDFLYHSAVLQRLKGWGKDPVAACLGVAAMFAEVTFDHWNGDVPVGREEPNAWVQIVAVSLDQTKNTMKLLPSLISAEARQHYGIQVGKENVYGLGDTRAMHAVTSSPLALEGPRPTLVVRNEALALDTPIPTPSGWTTMGEIRLGDFVYGRGGQPVVVVKALPVQMDRRCFRVTFSDGTSVVASDGHLWDVKVAQSDAKPRLRTTLDMFEDGRRFMVPRAGARVSAPVVLPVDPYLLGAWLGDGSTGNANITVGDEDLEELQLQLKWRGIETHLLSSPDRAPRISFSSQSGFGASMGTAVAKALRAMSCYRDKHIPREYLDAGTQQRLELLRGLMDTDGCAADDGRAVFVGRERLARDVLELIRGLGQVGTVIRVPDPRSREGATWRVSFTPADGIAPFSFERKAAKVRHTKRTHVAITSIEEVASVPVRCIAVDAEDHLFQAGEAGHVTHNTQNWLSSNGGHEMAGTIDGNAAKSENGTSRILDICNAYRPGQDSVAERVREGWEATQGEQPEIYDFGLLYDSLEAPPEAPLTAEDAPSVVDAIRGDASWLSIRRITASILNPVNAASESRRKWYNQVTAAEDARYDPNDIKACAVPDALQPGDEIVIFGDGSKSDDATGLVAVRVSDGLTQTLHVQQPTKGKIVDREAVDHAVIEAFEAYKVVAFWFDPSHAKDENAEGDESFWMPLCDEWMSRYGRRLKFWATKTGDRAHAVAWDMSTPAHQAVFVPAVERLESDMKAREFRFYQAGAVEGSSWLRRHMENAKRAPNRYGVSLRKDNRESQKKIDLAVCAIGARMLWRTVLLSRVQKSATPGRGRVIAL